MIIVVEQMGRNDFLALYPVCMFYVCWSLGGKLGF